MKKLVFLIVAIILLGSCGNANMKVELSKADSNLVPATKVYAGYSFVIYRMEINGIIYLVNSEGGIVKE